MSSTSTAAHYDAVAEQYHEHYSDLPLNDLSRKYPANHFRLQRLMESMNRKDVKSVIEVGVGEGTPLKTMADAGLDVCGFDIAGKMVERSRQRATEAGLDAGRIIQADIQHPDSYSRLHLQPGYDALIAMGVMPHVQDDDDTLGNMSALVRPGGTVFIEFRNKLFSLFTMNRYTVDFILNDLLRGVSPSVKESLETELQSRLRTDMPPRRESTADGAPGYDQVGDRFHNPLDIHELFHRHGYRNVELIWYHYHPTVPWLEPADRQLFRDEAINLESDRSWRGMFLCSAFVVEAVKCDDSD